MWPLGHLRSGKQTPAGLQRSKLSGTSLEMDFSVLSPKGLEVLMGLKLFCLILCCRHSKSLQVQGCGEPWQEQCLSLPHGTGHGGREAFLSCCLRQCKYRTSLSLPLG